MPPRSHYVAATLAAKLKELQSPGGAGDVVPAADDLAVAQIERAGKATIDQKRTEQRIQYEDGTEFAAIFDDLTEFPTANGAALQVNGNAIFSTTGANPSNRTRALPVAVGEAFKLTADMVIPAGWTGKSSYIGVCTDAAAAANGCLLLGVTAAAPAGQAAFFRGADWGGSLANGGTTLPAGTYHLSMVGDGANIGMCVRAVTGTLAGQEWSARAPQSLAITHLIVSGLDSAALSGVSFSKLSAKKTQGTPPAPSTLRQRTKTNGSSVIIPVEGNGPQVHVTYSPAGNSSAGDRWRIVTPGGYDSRRSYPLVLFCHQAATGNELSPVFESRMRPLEQALLAAGFIIASAQDGAQSVGGSTNYTGDRYGNAASVANFTDLYRYVRDRYPLSGHVCLLGPSMGGATSLNLLAARTIPGIVAVCGIDGLYNLSLVPALSGSFATAIYAAYGAAADGSDFAAKKAGHDPALMDAKLWRGVGLRWYSGAGDTLVLKSAHADALVAKAAPYAAEANVIDHAGAHLDVSGYDAVGIPAFFKRMMQT